MPHSILIAGGGIGGLAAGTALRRAGFECAAREKDIKDIKDTKDSNDDKL